MIQLLTFLGLGVLLTVRLEVIGQGLVRGQHLGVVFREAIFSLEAIKARRRQLR